MASGPLIGGGGGDGSKEKHRWAESKVYTRKSHKPSSKPSAGTHQQPQQQSQQILETTTDDKADSSLHQPPPLHNNHRQQHRQQQHRPAHGSESTASDNGGPMSIVNKNNDGGNSRAFAAGNHANQNNSRTPAPSLVSCKLDGGGQRRVVINPASGPRHEVRELRSKLMEELGLVRQLVRRLEAREVQLATPTPTAVGYGTNSQLSANDTRAPRNGGPTGPHHPRLNLSVATGQLDNSSMTDVTEKEKRTPKANQYYRNSEFLLAKDKFPHSDSQKKSKTNGSKKNTVGQADHGTNEADKPNVQIFKSCAALLSKLMKHKHGWVFNKPVDVKGLGLHDYLVIIKQPMDLGTIKARITTNWYRSPREFAEDVRLTFRNAMTYNPKGQDVHIMAEQLSEIFEDNWRAIEADLTSHSQYIANKKAPPPPLDMTRILERSESTTHPAVPDSTPKALSYTPQSARSSATKKPKARDPHKRDMTYDEKQRLSNNLQNLPSEKLDLVVQIIKKRNSSLNQHDDEIEVDIDSVDTETLWELDRFVTNYKKSLSKNKRKAELSVQPPRDAGQTTMDKDKNEATAVVKPPQAIKPYEKQEASLSPGHNAEANADKENGSSSSSDSSTDSGSSSSDSDSESSSS